MLYLALKATKYGALVWQVTPRPIVGSRIAPWSFDAPNSGNLPTSMYHFANDLGQRHILRTCASPPGICHLEQVGVSFKVCIARGAGVPLARAAAASGFKGMTIFVLRKLARVLGLALDLAAVPNTEAAWVEALARHAWPTLTDDGLSRLLADRGRTAEEKQASRAASSPLFKGNNLDLVEGLCKGTDVGDECAEVRKTLQRVRTAKPPPSAPLAVPGVAYSFGGHAAYGPPHARKAILDVTGLTAKQVRALFPQKVGVVVSKDTTRFFRWDAQCPNKAPPTYVSKSWGPTTGFDEEHALRVVCTQIWAWHRDLTGVECPSDLTSPLM